MNAQFESDLALPQQPEHLWRHFQAITRIPRPSGQEGALRDRIIKLAEERGFRHAVDEAGNLVVYVPASGGCESAETVIIQNHLDMVTVKTGDKEHDFERDPLSLQVKDGWLSADRTTLGADNGVGVAAALAAMTDPDVTHPPMELLFTTEEETGLHGASNLDASLLTGTRMLNLDTEDWGELYIGCAGGYGYEAQRQIMMKRPRPGLVPYMLHLKGLSGGHSGIQIHEQLGNANKLLTEVLVDADELDWQLSRFRGGVAHNVIAREASVEILVDPEQMDQWQAHLDQVRDRWLGYLPEADQGLNWVFEPIEREEPLVASAADTHMILNLLSVLPHGAQSYNLQQPADLVDLSVNLAVVMLQDDTLRIQTSMRFFNENQARPLKHKLEALFEIFQIGYSIILDYPGWNPDFDSALVARTRDIAARQLGEVPVLKAIHAGLECGILKSKKPDLDIVSFGPTIKGAHSPTERLEIATVEPFWRLVTGVLEDLARV
ncbi:beta-Ala-His dipeptidase [Saccharospirillum salsuginis]|uniref:Cytosol non-specific dipeptidase n=1 Tax=Saccharospirillum salsuginis TaxID=418750 RepID=A0A918N7G9_9GAMM|nr:beta-Ala-His dipeptidase [Saccharospirillum salsuginis]GGX43971.1 aminoacyl-histidine dipeptidase [Saccharospirillum salsuginis]